MGIIATLAVKDEQGEWHHEKSLTLSVTIVVVEGIRRNTVAAAAAVPTANAAVVMIAPRRVRSER